MNWQNGLNHNLVVRKLDNGKYELISGERRYTALTQLVEQGNEIFALVPCKVIEANDIDSEIILIQANAQTRELTEIEKLEQVKNEEKRKYNDKNQSSTSAQEAPGSARLAVSVGARWGKGEQS